MPQGRKVIIAGAGRVGGLVDRILRVAGIETTAIDYSSRRLAIMERFGTRHFFGDATRPDLLAAAGIAEAQLLIITMDDADAISALVQYVRKAYPHVQIVARAIDRDHVYDLWAHGCRNIIRETYDSTLRIGRSALEELGVPQDRAQAAIDAFNARDREAMLAVASAHKVGVAPHENEEYVARVLELRGDWEAQLRAEIADILRGTPIAPRPDTP